MAKNEKLNPYLTFGLTEPVSITRAGTSSAPTAEVTGQEVKGPTFGPINIYESATIKYGYNQGPNRTAAIAFGLPIEFNSQANWGVPFSKEEETK